MSAAHGEFAFATQVPSGSLGSVLWVTHARFEPRAIILSDDLEQRYLDVQLEPGTPTLVVARRSSGEPLPGATVRFLAGETPASSPERGVFFLEREVGPEGVVQACLLPGRNRIVASYPGEPDVSWEGSAPHEVELVFGSHFFVRGAVDGKWDPKATVVAMAECAGKEQFSGSFELSGGPTFESWALPLHDEEAFTFTLSSPEIVPTSSRVPRPAPDETVRLEFLALPGRSLRFRVTDLDHAPLEGASVQPRWPVGEGWYDGSTYRTDEEGFVEITNLPDGPVWVTASLEAFERETNGPYVEPNPGDDHFLIRLAPGGKILGRCLRPDGEPATDFRVVVWPGDRPELRETMSFEGRKSGDFELTEAPLGEVLVAAHTQRGLGSAPVAVDTSRAEEREIILQLQATSSASGRIVDQVTGEPVPGAELRTILTLGEASLRVWGDPAVADTSGRFEVGGLFSWPTWVRIDAEGYATRNVRLQAMPGAVADAGDLPLERSSPVVVGLIAGRDLDPTSFTVDGADLEHFPRKAFDSSGTVVFDGVPPGTHQLWLNHPDGSYWAFLVEHVAGRTSSVTFDLSASHRVEVEVAAGPDEALERGLVSLSTAEEDGTRIWFKEWSPGELLHFPGIPPGPVYAHLESEDGTQLAFAHGTMRADQDLHLTLRTGGRQCTIEVFGPDGSPVVGALVTVSPVDVPRAFAAARTDGTGTCTIHGLPRGPLVASVMHRELGEIADVPLSPPATEGEPVAILFDPSARIEAVFRDQGAPVRGVTARVARIDRPGPEDRRHAISDDGGAVSWSRLAEAAYVLRADHPSFWPVVREVRASASIDVALRRLGNLELTCRSRGAPAVGIELELWSIVDGVDVRAWAGEVKLAPPDLRTDATGTIRFQGLPAGDYRWRIRRGDASLEGVVTVRGKAVDHQVIDLP